MAKAKKAAETVEKVAKKVTKKAKEVAETVTRGVFTQRGK
tara:strand:+ start:155 stop:274 length:120 start_codon:yes stop_codon:yes gene_type:complete